MDTTKPNDPTLLDLLRVLRRRQKIIYLVFTTCMGLAILLCFVTTPRYVATGIIELQKSSSDGLGLESILGGVSGGGSDSLGASLDIQTQSSIMQSRRIALNVIRDLHLEENNDFKSKLTPVSYAFGLVKKQEPSDPPNLPFEDSPIKRERVVKLFKHNLKVKSLAGTRLIEVDFANPDPKVAKAVAEDVLRQLIEFSFRVRFKAATDTSKWLEVQLADLRNQTTGLQSRLVAMQKDTGLFGVGGTDMQGKPVVYSPVLDRLQAATAALTQAQSNRILKGAIYEAAKSGNAELLSQLSGPGLEPGANPGVANSLSLIQSLRSQEANLQAQLAQESNKYGPAYPKLIEQRLALSRVQESLHDETERIRARAENDYLIARQSESGIRATYDAVKVEAERLNDKAIEFTIVQREADESQQLYQDLLRRLKEAGVIEGLHSSNLTVVDQPVTPAHPATPNVPLYLIAGAGLGLFLGVGGAFVTEAVDNRIISSEDVDGLGFTLLGIAPELDADEQTCGSMMLDAPHSIFSESMRSLRSSLLLSRAGVPPQALLVTSPGPGEGKSTLSLNIAVALAQNNKRVLLVEADMRRPVMARRLGLGPCAGLSEVLSRANGEEMGILLPGSSNVWILPAGLVPPYPAELLSSTRFGQLVGQIKQSFDFVVFDTAPSLPVVDVQLIAPFVDTMVLVARSRVTSRTSLQRSFNQLRMHASNPERPSIGVVLNAVPTASSAYYDYYGYKQYGYYHGGESK